MEQTISDGLRRLEKRQLSKIEPLTPLNIPQGADAKTTKKILALHRKELKLQREARYIEALKEVGLGSVAAIIYSSGQVAKAGVDGIFDVIGKYAGNDSPVVFAAETITALAVFEWFVEAYPGVAKRLRIDNLAFRVGFAPPSETVNGQFLLELRNNLNGTLGWRSYATEALRDAAVKYFSTAPHDFFFTVITTQEGPKAPPLGPGISRTASSVPQGAIGPFDTIGEAATALATGSSYANQGYVFVRVNGIIYIAPPGSLP